MYYSCLRLAMYRSLSTKSNSLVNYALITIGVGYGSSRRFLGRDKE